MRLILLWLQAHGIIIIDVITWSNYLMGYDMLVHCAPHKSCKHDCNYNDNTKSITMMFSVCHVFPLYQHIQMMFFSWIPHLKLYGGGDGCHVWCSNGPIKLALAQLWGKVAAACHFHRSRWTDLAWGIQVDQNPRSGVDPRNVPGRNWHHAMCNKTCNQCEHKVS